MSEMAATEFVDIFLLCRANQERRNPDILVAVTEVPTGLFPFETKCRNPTVTRQCEMPPCVLNHPVTCRWEAFHADSFSFLTGIWRRPGGRPVRSTAALFDRRAGTSG
jgi:hypothetical protein